MAVQELQISSIRMFEGVSVLELEMVEKAWIRRAAALMQVSYWPSRRGKCWETTVEGYKAFEIVKIIRPYLYGLKAVSAAIILTLDQLSHSQLGDLNSRP